MHTTLVQLVCLFYRRLKSFTTMEFILQADVLADWKPESPEMFGDIEELGPNSRNQGRARTGNAQSQKPAAHPPPQAKAAVAIQAKRFIVDHDNNGDLYNLCHGYLEAAIQVQGKYDQERIEKQEEKEKTTREEDSRGRFLI
ncbi:hypothetical protein LIER_41598 [Lithospermum erythrorhizon]|uniref:Uncharacterized protein n=1 Tax=Lithospermum erythrorhizon TaxID=34254 RepID=A0AAV3RBR1_LITER